MKIRLDKLNKSCTTLSTDYDYFAMVLGNNKIALQRYKGGLCFMLYLSFFKLDYDLNIIYGQTEFIEDGSEIMVIRKR